MNILVSACLLGIYSKWDGSSNIDMRLVELINKGLVNLIPVCPEQLGGLPTPREPSEIMEGRVYARSGSELTLEYNKGASETLRLARLYNCKAAILKDRSPMCGSGRVYDGTFQGKLTDGNGIAAAALKSAGIKVYGEKEIGDFILSLMDGR